VVGRGQPLSHASLPFVAIPTTAGTGSEVTRNAVLSVPDRRVKVSLRSPLMLPRVAIVDSTLTHDVPPAVTAATGLDALTQLIEPFLSVRATPMTDALCRDGIPRVARSLRRAVEAGHDAGRPRRTWRWPASSADSRWPTPGSARCTDSPGRLGACSTHHNGAVCAALLPHVMAANLRHSTSARAGFRRAGPDR